MCHVGSVVAHGRVEGVAAIGVWAPGATRVRALVAGEPVELVAGADGWWSGADAAPGTDYAFLLNETSGGPPAVRVGVPPPMGA